MIPLQQIIHCSVHSCEEVLVGILQRRNSFFTQRSMLQRALSEVRIRFIRALIAMRWHQRTQGTAVGQTSLAHDVARSHQFRPETNKTWTFIPPPVILPTHHLPTFEPTSRHTKMFLLSLGLNIPKRAKVVFLNSVIVVRVKNEYSLRIGASRHGALKLRHFSLAWPGTFRCPENLIVQLTIFIRRYLAEPESSLTRIDKLLQEIHCITNFILTLSRISEISSSFNITIEPTPSTSRVRLVFSPEFSPNGSFSLQILSGRLCISSDHITWSPNTVRVPQHRLFIRELSLRNFHPAALLTELRAYACETQLCVAAEMAQRTLRLIPTQHLKFTRDPKPLGPLFDSLTISVHNRFLMSIGIEHWAGRCIATIPYFIMAGRSAYISHIIPNWEFIPISIQFAVWNVLLRLATNGIFPQIGISPGMSSNLYQVRYLRRYSFAPDFTIGMESLFGHPRITILNQKGIRFSRPEAVKMDCSSTRGAWRSAKAALFAAKRCVFLAQTQQYLTDFKIKSCLMGETLSIELPCCVSCIVTCKNENWKFVCIPKAHILSPVCEKVTKIHGAFSSRCALVVARLIYTFQVWRSSVFDISSLSNISYIDYDTHQIFFDINGNLMILSLMNTINVDYVSDRCKRCTVPFNFHPEFDLKASATTLLRHLFPKHLAHYEIAAFIHCAAIPILQIVQPFQNLQNRWLIVPATHLYRVTRICLIYKNRYPFVMHVQSIIASVITIPKFGETAKFVVGLTDFQLHSGGPSETVILQFKLGAIPRIRQALEHMADLFENAQEALFSQPVLSPDSKIAVFKQKIGGHILELSIAASKVSFAIQGCDLITERLNNLLKIADDVPAVVLGLARLTQVFLPADQTLFAETLRMFESVVHRVGFVMICHAMQSAIIQNDGNATLVFDWNGGINMSFPVPFGGSAHVLIRSASGCDRARGMTGVISALGRLLPTDRVK